MVRLSGQPESTESQTTLREAEIVPSSVQPSYTHNMEPKSKEKDMHQIRKRGCTVEKPHTWDKPATKGDKLAKLLTSYRATAP